MCMPNSIIEDTTEEALNAIGLRADTLSRLETEHASLLLGLIQDGAMQDYNSHVKKFADRVLEIFKSTFPELADGSKLLN